MEHDSTTEMLEALNAQTTQPYVLKLYIIGMTSKARHAINTLNKLCEEELKGRYTLEVIDLKKRPTLALSEQIIAIPTLVRELPTPLRKIVGDLSDRESLVVGLDLRPMKGG